MDDPLMPLSYLKNAYQPAFHEYIKENKDDREPYFPVELD